MNNTEFKKMLSNYPELKKDLFIRGFLITSKEIDNTEGFPFYGNWKFEKHNGYNFMCHYKTNMHIYCSDNNHLFFIFGHAYNPFTMEYDELEILKDISKHFDTNSYIDKINELTGVFVYGTLVNNDLEFLVDPSGMQSACYGKISNDFYISSHPQLVGDLCNLKMDDFVKELINYKWYGRVMGPYLPSDLTAFSELKRVIPNISYCYNNVVTHKRIWPTTKIKIADNSEDYNRIIKEASTILKNNMELVSKKWHNPWISLTGGIDSNTTFAAANGLYDKFETFSYISAEKEIPDAQAAKKISSHFGLTHHEYQIPNNNNELELFDEKRELFRHNNGYIAELYDNEARKKFYMRDVAKCDVEVKSWVSETIRAYWYKHYGRKTMPKLSAKLFRNLYKIFITNRSLAHKIDKLFEEYINEYEYRNIPEEYPPADMHYNEVTWGSWGGLNITEMKYCFDITFIYNNRKFLDLLFRVPLDKRISDQHHMDMKKFLNPELYDLNIRVVNLKETKLRAFLLNVIFTINSILPF